MNYNVQLYNVQVFRTGLYRYPSRPVSREQAKTPMYSSLLLLLLLSGAPRGRALAPPPPRRFVGGRAVRPVTHALGPGLPTLHTYAHDYAAAALGRRRPTAAAPRHPNLYRDAAAGDATAGQAWPSSRALALELYARLSASPPPGRGAAAPFVLEVPRPFGWCISAEQRRSRRVASGSPPGIAARAPTALPAARCRAPPRAAARS